MGLSKRNSGDGFDFSQAFDKSFSDEPSSTEIKDPPSKIDFASAFQESFEEKKNGGSVPSSTSSQSESKSEPQSLSTETNEPPIGKKYNGFFGVDVSGTAKDFNTKFEDLTGYKSFDLNEPAKTESGSLRNLLGNDLQKKREESFEDKKRKAYEAEMPKVDNLLNNVYYGTIPAEQIQKAIADPVTKNVIQNKVNEIAPQFSDLSNPENVINAAKKIKEVNRVNYVKAEQQGIFEGDKVYNTIVSELAPVKPKNFEPAFSNKDAISVDLTGSNALVDRINEAQSKLSVTDFNDPAQVSNAIANVKDLIDLQSGYYEGDKRAQEVEKSVNLYKILDNRLKFNTSKAGISPKLSAFDSQIGLSVIGELSQIDRAGEQTDLTKDKSAINQFKWGLTLIEKADPVLYKNVTNALSENKGVAPVDFSHIMKLGQEVSNMTIVRDAAINPELIDKETDNDYTTYSERKADAARLIADKLQSLDMGSIISVPSAIVKKMGKDLGINPNITNDLAREEQIPFYDAIPKSGVGSAVVRGVTDLLGGGVNTFMTFGETPAESYLRSKSLDLGLFKGQQIPSKGGYLNKTQKDADNIAIGVAEGAGQFLGQLGLTYAAGGLLLGGARAATLGVLNPTGKLAESIIDYGGTALSMYAQTYGDMYQEYMKKTGDVETSKLAANIDAWTQGIIETALPTTQIARAGMKGLRNEFTDGIVDVIKKGGDISALRDKGRSVIKKYASGVLKVLGIETTEEEVQNLEGFISEYIFSPQTAKDRNLAKEAWDTFKATTISLAIPALFGGIGDARTRDFTKSSLHKAAMNSKDYIASLESMRDKGHLSDEEYNQGIKLINTHKQSIENAPIVDLNGNKVDDSRGLDYAFEDTKIKIYNDKIANTTGVQKEMWETKKKESEKVQRSILMPDTKLSQPIEGLDEQGIPIGENVPAPEINATNEAEIGTFEDKVRTLYPALKNTDNAGVNDFVKENATDSPSKFIKEFGEDKFNEVVSDITIPELKSKLKTVKQYTPDSEDVSILDKAISAKEDEAIYGKKGEPRIKLDFAESKPIIEPPKPISEMNSEEIGNYATEVRQALRQHEKEFANKTEKEKEDGGYYDYIDNVAELRDTEQRVNFVENSENLNDLANSTKSALRDFNKDNPSQESLAILNAAKKKAAEMNIVPETLIKEVIKKVGNDYKDKEDAEFMMRNYLEKIVPEKPTTQEQGVGNTEQKSAVDKPDEPVSSPVISDKEGVLTDDKKIDYLLNQNIKNLHEGKLKDNEGRVLGTDTVNTGIESNGLETLTEKKWGHGSSRETAKNSIKTLDRLLSGEDFFKGDFGHIYRGNNEGHINTYENGKFIITTDSPESIFGKNGEGDYKLKPKDVEIILNDSLSPFGQELANKHPDFVIKDYNGNVFKSESQQPSVNKESQITSAKVINDGYAAIKEKLGEKKTQKYFEQADRLINPNENEIVEYRPNGIVTKEGDKYTFHALADMDLKNWRIGFKSDVTDQFKKENEQNTRTASGTDKSIPTEIKEPKGQENKGTVQPGIESGGQLNAEVATAVLKEGKYAVKAKRIADNIRKSDLPQWLVNTDPTIKQSGVSAESLKNAFADAVEHAGKLLDKGVEIKDALKEAADKIIDHILTDYPKGAKLKAEREKQIRDGFENYYKDNIFESEPVKSDAGKGNKPPTEEGKVEEGEDKPKMRSVYKNVIERSKSLTAKQKKMLADDPVAMYYTLPNDKAKEIALEIIKEMGVENAVAEASRKNSALEPFEKVMILGAAMDYYAGLSKAAEKNGNANATNINADLEIDASDKMMEAAQSLATLGTSLGRGINMFNEVYKLSNIALSRKLKKNVDQLNKLLNPQVNTAVEVVKDIINDDSVNGIGDSMTDADAKQSADMKSKISSLQKQIDDLKKQVAANTNAPKGSKKNPLNITRQTNTTEYDKRLKAFRQKHRSGISNEDLADLGYFGLYHIENGLTKFSEWYGVMSRIFSKYKNNLRERYFSARDIAIENGAQSDLFNTEDEVDNHLEALAKESDARKMAQLTKRKAIAEFNRQMENNPDRARIIAPRIAAERVRRDAERNLGMVTTKNEQNYLKKLVGVVQAKAREYYKETNENIRNVNDILGFAIANGKSDYQIWERTQQEVESQIDSDDKLNDDEKKDVKDFLKEYTDSIFETLLTNNQQEEIVRKKLIEAGYNTERTINGKVVQAVDWNKVISNSKNIKEAREAIKQAILSVGFTEQEAKNEIDAVLNQFDNKVLDKKQAAINSYLKRGIINKVKGALGVGDNKTKIHRLIDMNNKGILDDSRVKDVLANDLGIISLTDEDLKKVRELSELIDNPKIPAFQKKKYEEQLQYLFDSKGGNLTYLEFREFLANNRLTSVYNNIQNLTGWFRGISTYITVAAKIKNPLSAAKIAKREFKNSISDALTILLNGDVSRGTSFADLTRSTEGEPRVRYLEQGKGKLLGLPDAYVKVGGKTFNANILNTAYKGVKYVARVLESADTVPSNVISGLTQYWQIRKQLQFLHPEWSGKQIESKTYETMYSVGLAESMKEAMEGFKEAGIVPSKYQINRAIHDINTRARNELLSKEFYDTVEDTKKIAEARLINNGNANPTGEQITDEVYAILGRDEPLDVVARGERQALRETGKKSTFGLAGLVLWPLNAINQSLKRNMLSSHTNREKWLINTGDAAVSFLVPYANSIGRWIEMGIELSPYGIAKGLVYKMGVANSFEGLKEGNITVQELSELGDDYIIRGIQGSSMLLAAMYLMTLLNGEDDDEKDIDVTGTYRNPSYPKERIQSVGNPDQTLTVKGYKIPLGLIGNAAYPLIMYKDFMDKRTNENERHGILYTTAAVYLTTSAQSVSSRLDGYGNIFAGLQSGKQERYLPQLGKVVGSNTAASLIPFNRLQQEISQLWNPKSEQSLTFGENLLQQFSIVGALGKEYPSFDYRGREYDFGEVYTGSADGIVKMFEKSKRSDKIDKKLSELDFAATDAFRESKDEENYKYVIVNKDGTNRFMTTKEYYNFKKITSQKFNEKLTDNFDIINGITILNRNKEVNEEETKKAMNDTYSKLLTLSKEQALDSIQARTGFIPDKRIKKIDNKLENKLNLIQKKRQLIGLKIQ